MLSNAIDFTADTYCPVSETFPQITLFDELKKNKYTLLFFYPLDFTFVCPTELQSLSLRYSEFTERNVNIFGISVDSKYCHHAWCNTPRSEGGMENLSFTLVADLTKEISKSYDVLLEDGVAGRGVFIIDSEQKIRYQSLNDLPVGRNVDEILRLLQEYA